MRQSSVVSKERVPAPLVVYQWPYKFGTLRSRAAIWARDWVIGHAKEYGLDDFHRFYADLKAYLSTSSYLHLNIEFRVSFENGRHRLYCETSANPRPVFEIMEPSDWVNERRRFNQFVDIRASFPTKRGLRWLGGLMVEMTWWDFSHALVSYDIIRKGVGICRQEVEAMSDEDIRDGVLRFLINQKSSHAPR